MQNGAKLYAATAIGGITSNLSADFISAKVMLSEVSKELAAIATAESKRDTAKNSIISALEKRYRQICITVAPESCTAVTLFCTRAWDEVLLELVESPSIIRSN